MYINHKNTELVCCFYRGGYCIRYIMEFKVQEHLCALLMHHLNCFLAAGCKQLASDLEYLS